MKPSSLTQYTALYDSRRADIDAHSAPALNALRPEARRRLEGARLPDTRTEGYEKTSIEDMFAPDFGINVDRINLPVDVAASFRCDVPTVTTQMAFVVNDTFVPSARLTEKLPEGVKFMSLRQAAEEYPALVEAHYGKLAPLGEPAVALNTMLAQDGVFIHIPAGVRMPRALQLVNILSSPVPLAAFRRILVVMEAGSELQLLVCDHTQPGGAQEYLASQVVEVSVGRGARFEACAIEEASAATRRHSRMYLSQAEGSAVTFNSTTLTCGTTRNDYDISLTGEHAECRLAGMVIGSDRMHADNNTMVRHLVPRCKSDQLFKYVVDDEAHGAFEGSIVVSHGAAGTEAYQSNRNILASGGARMHCKPQLEIYNDDVKCSHGATTGQLDESALFYMRQRGIPLAEARTMLMQAFMVDVIDTVHIPGLRERLLHLTDRRFAGTLGDCSGCRKEC